MTSRTDSMATMIGVGLMGVLLLAGMGKLMDHHKKKLEELQNAAKYARDPETIANLNLHASLLVGELLCDVKQIGRRVADTMELWDKDMQEVRRGTTGELTTIREILQKAFAEELVVPSAGDEPEGVS